MRTQVFAYKGLIGIKSDIKAEGLLNNPLEKGQLGFIIKAEFVDIQLEALELLKTIPKSCDAIGDVDVEKYSNGISFSWLGGPMRLLDPKKVSGSRYYDPSLISAKKDVETPKDFIDYINNNKT
jgi:hypothetical protein